MFLCGIHCMNGILSGIRAIAFLDLHDKRYQKSTFSSHMHLPRGHLPVFTQTHGQQKWLVKVRLNRFAHKADSMLESLATLNPSDFAILCKPRPCVVLRHFFTKTSTYQLDYCPQSIMILHTGLGNWIYEVTNHACARNEVFFRI